jgi:hypothetical protein
MFANLIQLITGRPPHSDLEHPAFIEELRVYPAESRNPKFERIILVCWILIAVKHVFIIWACQNFPVPFHQLWVNFPTWLLGALATGIYFGQIWRSYGQAPTLAPKATHASGSTRLRRF